MSWLGAETAGEQRRWPQTLPLQRHLLCHRCWLLYHAGPQTPRQIEAAKPSHACLGLRCCTAGIDSWCTPPERRQHCCRPAWLTDSHATGDVPGMHCMPKGLCRLIPLPARSTSLVLVWASGIGGQAAGHAPALGCSRRYASADSSTAKSGFWNSCPKRWSAMRLGAAALPSPVFCRFASSVMARSASLALT